MVRLDAQQSAEILEKIAKGISRLNYTVSKIVKKWEGDLNAMYANIRPPRSVMYKIYRLHLSLAALEKMLISPRLGPTQIITMDFHVNALSLSGISRLIKFHFGPVAYSIMKDDLEVLRFGYSHLLNKRLQPHLYPQNLDVSENLWKKYLEPKF